MTIAQEEIFGPVLSVLEYDEPEEAIEIANGTEFGLAGGVFTRDLDKATETAGKLEAGQIYVNSWFTGSVATPFGGYKQSGYSREKGQEAIKSYLQVKNVGIQL
jgi:aldehyde dehydrogenase (NAD+)